MEDVNKLPDKLEWIDNFLQSKKYSDAQAEITKIRLNHCVFFDNESFTYSFNNVTPRHADLMFGKLHIQPFYILDYISSQNNDIIYDIGCGYNFFKKFYNIVGIDPNSNNADIIDKFDDAFIKKYKGQFTNAISINAIHFCDVSKIIKRLQEFYSLIKIGGYGYVAINLQRVLDCTNNKINKISNLDFTEKVLNHFFPTNDLIKDFSSLIETAINSIKGELIFFQNNCYEELNDPANGNIRILFKRA